MYSLVYTTLVAIQNRTYLTKAELIETNREPIVGDLVYGSDSYYAQIIRVGEGVVEITVIGQIANLQAIYDLLDTKVDISKQVPKTPGMTTPVGIDDEGKLWVASGSGEGEEEEEEETTIIKVREMGSLDTMVTYEGDLQPNLTSIIDGDFKVYNNTFDNVFPYNKMKEVLDDKENVFIEVPPIWFKFYHDVDGNLKGYDMSNKQIDDTYDLFPIHKKGSLFIGKYQANSFSDILRSVSGVIVSTNLNIQTFRDRARANGDKYFANDWQTWNILQYLLTAYFGTTNSDNYFPDLSDSRHNTGVMNGYKTAYRTTSGKNTFFGIENILKNAYHFIDGVINNNDNVWFAEDYEKYSNSITADYELKGVKSNEKGYIKEQGGGFGNFPKVTVDSSSTTYYADYMFRDSGLRVLVSGSRADVFASGGVWLWHAYGALSYENVSGGSRLIMSS